MLIQQIVGLMDEADEGVGADGGIGVVQPGCVERPAFRIGQIGQIRRIRRIRRILVILFEALRDLPDGPGFGAVVRPLRQVAVAQEVFVVEKEFFEAGAGDIYEAQFGLRRGGGGAAALGYVLASGAGGLHHLVCGARAGIEKAFAKPVGGIVDEGGGLEARRAPVSAAGSDFCHDVLMLGAGGLLCNENLIGRIRSGGLDGSGREGFGGEAAQEALGLLLDGAGDEFGGGGVVGGALDLVGLELFEQSCAELADAFAQHGPTEAVFPGQSLPMSGCDLFDGVALPDFHGGNFGEFAPGKGADEIIERREASAAPVIEQGIVFAVRVGIANEHVEDEAIEKVAEIERGERGPIAEEPDAVAYQRSAFLLVFPFGGHAQRLAEIFLMEARDGAIGGAGAIIALNKQTGRRAHAPGVDLRDGQAQGFGEGHAKGLGGDESGEAIGLRFDDMRAGGVAQRQRDDFAAQHDRQLGLRAGQ